MGILRARRGGGLPPAEYGTALHDVVAEVIRRRFGSPAGWSIYAEQSLSTFADLPTAVLCTTVEQYLAARPALRFLRDAIPRRLLPILIGNLRPDLVIRGPGGTLLVWDTTSVAAVDHVAKTTLYAQILSEGRIPFRISETWYRGLKPIGPAGEPGGAAAAVPGKVTPSRAP
jgi:hypothetical protein